ncbi:flavin reductase family protein [Actinomadura xylanilytica]|uniref:flavin reductase family protein n=1 Tax=Actinomadura xylanilytica TaxID=887459 RepID=UPI00255B2503|nr:flavin reductase family protein [Actinomadura xylanilytica]MDL4772176.1 flavin reductase family protein [Actinomadura xylanilytica]
MRPGPPVVDAELLRQVAGRFATGVTVVTTVAGGADHALTVTAFTSVSLDPPLVMVSVAKAAPFHGAVLRGGRWAVSVLSEDMRAIAERFAAPDTAAPDTAAPDTAAPDASAPEVGRPEVDGPGQGRGAVTGAVIFTGGVAALECRTHAVHDCGDHSLVVGEVLALDAPDVQGGPLIVYRDGYRTFG